MEYSFLALKTEITELVSPGIAQTQGCVLKFERVPPAGFIWVVEALRVLQWVEACR